MTGQRKQWYLILLFSLLTLLCTAFIFSNSLKSGSASGHQSGRVLSILRPILDPNGHIPVETLHFFIRKLAHGTEFCMLAICLGGLLWSIYAAWGRTVPFLGLFLALGVAVTDEFIQSFTGRTSSVRDVLIDFSGALVGFLLVGAVFLLSRRLRTPRPR